MVLGKLPVPGRPTIWMTVRQGPIALAVGAGGGCLDIFTLLYLFSSPSPSLWETARYKLKYCLKGPLNPKQPTNQRYNLRNSINLQAINARSNQYFSSFLPFSVRAWNNLSREEKQHESINSFKCFLQKDETTVPKHYYTGCRKGKILLASLRTNCGSLIFDLFVKTYQILPYVISVV